MEMTAPVVAVAAEVARAKPMVAWGAAPAVELAAAVVPAGAVVVVEKEVEVVAPP